MPVFISEREPMKNRENLYELLEECDMDYWDPLEQLIRTDSHYFGDRLYVQGIDAVSDSDEAGNQSKKPTLSLIN